MTDADERLLQAIAFIDHPSVSGNFIKKMEIAIRNGADVDGITEDGQTPLTAAIEGGMGSPSAVEFLLKNGADPNKRDQNNWTPWGVCVSRLRDRSVARKMLQIRSLLEKENVDRGDEYFVDFEQAIGNGDFDVVRKCLDEGIDLSNPIISPLGCAISTQNIEMLRMLLSAGADVDMRVGEEETPLIYAAMKGHLESVKLLIEYRADITKYAWGDMRCTAEFMARENGHETLAEWLLSNSTDKPEKRMIPEKFQVLYDKKTDGVNVGLTTHDIVAKLQDWDKQFGITVSDVEQNGFAVSFMDLPEGLEELVRNISDFCPDVIDQGYGCLDDALSMAEESGNPLSPETLALIDGIDFSDDDFGLRILARDLRKRKAVKLWWD